jgi:hypothetical protein
LAIQAIRSSFEPIGLLGALAWRVDMLRSQVVLIRQIKKAPPETGGACPGYGVGEDRLQGLQSGD